MALLTVQAGSLPVSVPTSLSLPFWEGAAAGELRYLHCSSCGRADFPAAPNCRFCLGDSLVWKVSAGLGTVYSYTVVWRPVTPDFTTPYAPAIIVLDEGYAMMSNVIGLDSADVAVDLRVVVHFATVGGGVTLPYFRPAAPGEAAGG